MGTQIERMNRDDWEAVRSIYREGIETGHATLDTAIPDWNVWDAEHRSDCRIVARDADRVVGWAALSPVSERCVYGGVAEVSVYVAGEARGKGLGKALLQALIDGSEEAGLWTLQAGILPENRASIHLHKKLGFREVGRRERIGQRDGVWRDEILLERRSPTVGA